MRIEFRLEQQPASVPPNQVSNVYSVQSTRILPASAPVIRSRRVLSFAFFICVALLTAGFGPPKMVDREFAATQRLTPGELRQWSDAAEPPPVTAAALIVYDVEAARTLYARNAETALPPASLTKLMTALLALESGRLREAATVREEDLTGGATMGLVAGETVTVEELLWGVLLPSGNDAAMTMARHLGGDASSFVAEMNRRAAELGMDATNFHNPHGLHEEGHVSSAADLMNIALALLEYPLFREIVGSRTAEIAGRTLLNTNELLGGYPGANGVKTGTTPEAGECLIASIETDGHEALILVLGSSDRYGDVQKLHALYQANYIWAEGDGRSLSVLNRLYDADGELTSLLVEGEPASVLLHRWGDPEMIGFRRIDRFAEEDALDTDTAGSVEWRVGDSIAGVQELAMR